MFIALVASIPIAFFVGGVTGFTRGFNAALYGRSADAAITVYMLRHLRAGDRDTAIEMLEMRLDELIVDNEVAAKYASSIFDLPALIGVRCDGCVDKLAAPAIQYRRDYPHSGPTAQLVRRALADLERRLHRPAARPL